MADDELYTDASDAEDNSSDEESPSSSGASALTSDKVFPALISAFSSQESGGNYSAVNSRTSATGKYQILPNNIRQWSKDILGKEVSPEQFKKNPQIQDQIAHAKLSEYYNSALSMTGGDPVEAAKLTANKWYTGNYNPKNDSKRPHPAEPSPAEYRAQLMGKLGLKLGATIGTAAPDGGAMQAPITAPIVTGGKPFSLEDVFNDNQDSTQTQLPAPTAPVDTTAEQPAQRPSTPAPSADMLRWQGIVKKQQQIDAEKAKAPAPVPQAKQTTSFDPQTAAYKYAIGGGLQKPVADNIPPVLAPKPGTEQPTFAAESTKQRPVLTPEAFASQHAYRDKMAQEQAAQLGVPVRGSSGIYRPYVAPDGTKGSVLSSNDTESKIQDVQDEKTKQVQNAALSALGNTGVGPGSLLFGLASKSEVVKGIANVGIRAADLTLGGLPSAIAPKQMGALEEATTSTSPAARTVEQVAGTALGIAGSIGAGAFKVAGIASEGILGRLAVLGAKNLVEKPAVGLATTLGLEAIPREAVKAATGQQTVGEAASQVGQAALSGAVLGGGGQVGSKLAEAAQAGRFGTTAIKAATGAATMSAVNVLTGNAPDLQSALLGAAMEGRAGIAEGAFRGDVNAYKRNLIKSLDKDNIIDHTVAAVGKVRGDTPVSGFAVGRADVVDAVKQAVDEGALLPADAMNSAVSKLHDKFGAGIDKDKFIDDAGREIDNRLTQPATVVAEDQTPVTTPKEDVLAETPHVAAGGQYETDSPLIERQIKTGKNRGKIQRGVVATDLSEEQVQSITNRAPVKEGEGFFIPERYVKRPVSEEPVQETVPQVEPQMQGQPAIAQETENVPLETERTPAEAQIPELSQAESFERPLSNEDVRGGKAVQPADIISEQPSEKEQTNAAQVRNEPENRVAEHIGVTSGSDLRSNEEEVRQSQSEQAGNRNRAFEEAGIRTGQEAPITQSADQETRQRIIDETNKKIYPESPNNPPIKAIRDYAIRNRVPTTDETGKSLGWKQQLDAIHTDAIGKAARPITEDMGVARGEEARPLSPMESAGTLQATVPLAREVASEIKPKLESFVNWVRDVSSGIARGVAPQTRITRISAEDVKPSDLHNTQFTYDGNLYKLKRERQADDSFRSEFYQNGKRVINPSDELRTKLTNAATKSYIDNARLSAQRSALLLRDISATQARAVAIKVKEVEDLRSVFASRSDVDNHRLISDIMADRPLTDPIEQKAAQSIRKIFREQGQRIMDAGKAVGKDIHFDLRDTFFSLLWKDTSRARLGQVLNAKRPVGGTKYFMQKKVFQDIAEGIEKGLMPAYSNPFDFVMHYVAESERMIAGMNALKSLKDMGYGRIIKSAKFAPAGWERVEALEKFTKNREGQLVKAGEFYAPSGAAQVLNNYFSQGISGPFLGKTYAGWMHLNNHLNQLQLSLSGFHATFVTMESIMSRVALGLRESVYGISHGEKKFITQGVTKIATALTAPRGTELGKNVQTEWFKPGTTGDNMATMIADALMHGGYRGEMPREYQAGKPKIVSGKGALRSTGETAISPLKEAAKDIKDGRYIAATIGTGIRYLELPTRAILEKYVPHMKFMAATELAKFELERFTFEHGRDATPEEMRGVTEKVVNVIDDRFGELAYDNLFWNKTFKQTAMGLQRSVGWNYGVLRTIFGGSFDAVKNSILLAGKGLEKVSGGKYTQETSPEFTQRTAYVVAFPTVVAMIGSVLNFTLTGEPPQDIKDMFFPRTGGTDEHGNPARISIPSYATDAYNLGKDILSEFGEGSSHLFRTIGHKISPAISFVADIKNNKDYYEREIIPDQVPWYEGAADIAKFGLRQFTPFSINQLSKITTEGGGARNVLPFFGVKPAPPSINRTAMQEFLSDKSAEQMSAGGRSAGSVEQTQASRQIESLFRQGKTKEANDLANQKLREGIVSPDHILQARKDAQLSVRGSQLKRATDPNAMTAYFNVASDEERKTLAPEMTQKLLSINLYNITPSVARDYLNRFTEAESQGKTKYMDKNAAASYKRGLTGYIQLYENNRLPMFNFSPVPAK